MANDGLKLLLHSGIFYKADFTVPDISPSVFSFVAVPVIKPHLPASSNTPARPRGRLAPEMTMVSQSMPYKTNDDCHPYSASSHCLGFPEMRDPIKVSLSPPEDSQSTECAGLPASISSAFLLLNVSKELMAIHVTRFSLFLD